MHITDTTFIIYGLRFHDQTYQFKTITNKEELFLSILRADFQKVVKLITVRFPFVVCNDFTEIFILSECRERLFIPELLSEIAMEPNFYFGFIRYEASSLNFVKRVSLHSKVFFRLTFFENTIPAIDFN